MRKTTQLMALTHPTSSRISCSEKVAGLSRIIVLGAAAFLLAFPLGQAQQEKKEMPRTADKVSKPVPSLEQKQFPQGRIYVFQVPAQSEYKVLPAVSKTLATVKSQIWQTATIGAGGKKPVFIINGGFFDPSNSLTTSFIFQGGLLTADPRINPNLVNNDKLLSYLPKIFNRPEFRLYLCQKPSGSFQTRYDIAPRNAPVPQDCLLQSALGAGPTLLPKVEDLSEGFVDYNAAGKLIRDPVGTCSLNARSAVGITEKGDVLLLMAAQNASKPNGSGFNMTDLANLLKARGAVKAMALDGGSSSGFWHKGQAVFGKFENNSAPVIRPVKSVLMVVPL
jgi:hypothetical protein